MPRRATTTDPLEQKIEAALQPGSYIKYSGLRLARDLAACGSRRSGTGKTEIDDDRTWTALERNE